MASLSRPLTGLHFTGTKPPPGDAYDTSHVKELFDNIAPHQETWAQVGTFFLAGHWRKKSVDLLHLKPGETVCDLMSGAGSMWKSILPKIGTSGKLYALDLSPQMVAKSKQCSDAAKRQNVFPVVGDALHTPFPSGSMDAVVCGFGMKTLTADQQSQYVDEVKRLLKPGGRFSLVELSLPENPIRRKIFQAYLKTGFFILKTILGEKGKQMGALYPYLNAFKNCKDLQKQFESRGFDVQYVRLRGDAATALVGVKKDETP